MKIVEITTMYALQQYYCDTCWGDWLGLFFVLGIIVFFGIYLIVDNIQESNAEKQRIKREIERQGF